MMVAEEMQGGRFLLVRVQDNCRVALPLHCLLEVTRPLPVKTLAGAPAFVRGVAIVRASPVPVIDLAAILGIDVGSEATRFVILCVGGRSVAVAVESISGVCDLPAGTLKQAPPLLGDAAGELAEALGALDGELLLALKVARLLPADLCETLANTMGVA
jgi:purine-binding chemotaxis protein CheW